MADDTGTPRKRTSTKSAKAAPTPTETGAPNPPASQPCDPLMAGAWPQLPAGAFDPMAMLQPEQREALEQLSRNLARAAVTAQTALAGAALHQAAKPQMVNPDPFHVGPAMSEVMGSLAAHPDKLMQAQADLFQRYTDLWRSAALRMAFGTAEPVVQPAKGDKRFNDEAWSENPVFDMMKQSYLLTSNWLNDLVASAQGVDPLAKRRVEFFTKMLTDAFSPSNFLISNPAARKQAGPTTISFGSARTSPPRRGRSCSATSYSNCFSTRPPPKMCTRYPC